MKTLKELVRPNILALKPYSSARDEYSGRVATVFIDANENPYNNGINRYPDPLQKELKKVLAEVKGVAADGIFLGNGSDEAIDLLFRVFCEPGVDNVVAIDPTYGMYEVCADINDVAYRKVSLDEHYQMNAGKLLSACDEHTKLIFICSPNNPTGNDMDRAELLKVIDGFSGIVVVDEAYSDFSPLQPMRSQLNRYPNLVVLNTFSKAWGGAAIRLGMAFASAEIIGFFNKVKYPYNVNQLTQQKALEVLGDMAGIQKKCNMILEERANLASACSLLPLCQAVYPTSANFFLMKVTDANAIYNYLVDCGIIVRNRTNVSLCGNCLRVTIGTKEENNILLSALRKYKA